MDDKLLAEIVCGSYLVEGGSPIELQISEVLAYQPKSKTDYLFGFVKLQNGRLAAIWENHAYLGDTLERFEGSEEYDPQLNSHEKLLVRYGLK